MALATGASRATGFFRTAALASVLGVTGLGDAYNTANTIPNMVFTLVVGGVLTAAVVPILVQSHALQPDEPSAASALLGVTLVVGILASVAVAVSAPALVRALTAGASDRAGYEAYVALTTSWLRWFAPQIGLYALGVLAVSIMTAKRRLFLGAAAPIATNLITIGVTLSVVGGGGSVRGGVGKIDPGTVSALGAGTTFAVAVATVVQLWGAWRAVPGLRPHWNPGHVAVRGLGRRAGWMLLYVGANQVGLTLVVAIATSTPGGVSAYQWAFTLMQLPYALIAVSIMSAAYPAISRAVEATVSVAPAVRRTMTSTFRLLVPAAIGLAMLATPIAIVLVGRSGAGLVAAAALGFAVSLIPFTAFQLLTRVCYAHHDTRGPAFVNVAVNLVNVGAAFGLVAVASSATQVLGGLALAHATSYGVGVLLLVAKLAHRQILTFQDLFAGHLGTFAAAAFMGFVVWVGNQTAGPVGSRTEALVVTGALSALGLATFAVGTKVSRVLTGWNRP
ncbi:oligosaccharide flippase family protein [Aquihabitans sp. G128]|uniref:murein biosynthesis integral membrane protein MurJ n=1 Tax=Aquihabitans sp. G128 TaxID=2849779 RepID=UPI001C23AB39|nr:lipid II flippase MurJ [Aquihabitans sp. G128]QXC60637.1 oligosaccharide flippase family protein [Aquihabitans sp. G128]